MKSFGGVRRTAAGLVALVIAVSGLFVIGAATPASAGEVIPCTATMREGDGLPRRPSDQGMDEVVGVKLTMQWDQVDFYGSQIYLATDNYQGYPPRYVVNTIGSGARSGEYVFTTSGGGGGPVTEPGTYGANSEIIEAFRPYYAQQVDILRDGGNGVVPVFNWSLELTYYNCDSDGDGASDLIDRCPTVASDSQRDSDNDGLGDVCDPDDDGDGVADTSDNCPLKANADQTNSDGDQYGDACDSTPFPPAPTPTSPPAPAPTTPPAPTSTSSPTPSVPVAVPPPAAGASARVVTLKYVKKKRVFRGVVSSAVGSCAVNAEVTLWRQARRADRRLVVNTTNEAGKFRTPKVKRPGKYYVTVEADSSGQCAGAESQTRRIRRR